MFVGVINRRIKYAILPTIFVGILFAFLLCGFKIPRYVYGIDVSNFKAEKIEKVINEKIIEDLKKQKLVITCSKYSKRYEYTYPEINFSTNLREVAKNPKLQLNIRYYLVGFEEKVNSICQEIEKIPISALTIFSPIAKEKFSFVPESCGVVCNKTKFKEDILKSINGNFEEVKVITKQISPDISTVNRRENTKLLATFSTSFDLNKTDRVSNVILATKKINGYVLKNGQEFSFNRVVGVRNEQNGFKKAKIIIDGKYVDGYGGGVCQVSTTLYNVALLSNLTITEFHPHSLAVSYVEPSFDAMVSGSLCDLKFKNQTGSEVYIQGEVEKDKLTFTLYGKEQRYTILRKSEVVEYLDGEESIVYGDEDLVLQNEKKGVKSKGFLLYLDNDVVVKIEKIRDDFYQPTKKIVQKKQKTCCEFL